MQSTLLFLSELQQNNNKPWMDEHRDWYENSKKEFQQLVANILAGLKEFDDSLAGVEARDCIFRINRDIRFSKDKRPYKNNFAAYIAQGGKKSIAAGYYIHIQPHGESMLGGGIYQPPAEELAKIRQEVDYNPGELMQIVTAPKFKKMFDTIKGEKLNKAPKGYSPDHPNIEFLKLKSFFAMHPLSDEKVKADDLVKYSLEVFREIFPLNEYLNIAIS